MNIYTYNTILLLMPSSTNVLGRGRILRKSIIPRLTHLLSDNILLPNSISTYWVSIIYSISIHKYDIDIFVFLAALSFCFFFFWLYFEDSYLLAKNLTLVWKSYL